MANPYRRKITVGKDGLSDVYDVLAAFSVTCPATQHALKKLLLPGVRTGGKSRVQDLEEAVQSIQRAVELSKAYTNQEFNCPPGGHLNVAHALNCECQLCVTAKVFPLDQPMRWEKCSHPVLPGDMYCTQCPSPTL